MTFTKGYVPWNKGRQQELTYCFRHATWRQRRPCGSTYCPECVRISVGHWQGEHPERMAEISAKRRRK